MDGTKHEKLLNESILQKQHLRSTHFWFQKWVCSTMEIELVVVGRSGFFFRAKAAEDSPPFWLEFRWAKTRGDRKVSRCSN